MMSVFYPVAGGEGTRARLVDIFEPAVDKALAYLTEELEPEAGENLRVKLRSIGLQSIRHGAPRRSDAPYPMLIYYPGGGHNRFASVDVCEALASQGYVVLSMDGPHDASLVVFPDGHLCKGPLEGDYISPGVGDVGFLLCHLEEMNSDGILAGMIDADRVGVLGHSRGGYIANINAFLHERVKAAASIDCFLWGYWCDGTGLDKHPPDFQSKVRSMAKPLLRLCGRPAGTDPQKEAEFCLQRDGGDFVGGFSVVALPGWLHGDFATTPWLCGMGEELRANQSLGRTERAGMLVAILAAFFDFELRDAAAGGLENCIRKLPGVALAAKSSAAA